MFRWQRDVTLPRAAGMSSNYEKLEEVGGTPARPGAYDPHPAPPSSPPPVVAASPVVAAPGQQQIPTAAAAPQGAVPTAFAMPAGANGVPVHAQLHAASAGMYPVVMPDLPDAVEVRTRPSFDHRRALTFVRDDILRLFFPRLAAERRVHLLTSIS